MKNKFCVVLVLLALFVVGTACSLDRLTGGSDESESSGTTTEEAKKASGDETSTKKSSGGKVLNSGIAECDELAQYIEDNSEELKDANIIIRGIIYVYKNSIVQEIEKGVKDMTDEKKEELAKVCSKSLEQLKESQEGK